MEYDKETLKRLSEAGGQLEVTTNLPIENREDLSVAYTPGVAAPCLEIAENADLAYKYTGKGNLVAVVTDGSAVLGLGNIGAAAAIPVMEGKCALFKKFGNINAVPIALASQDPEEIIKAVELMAPVFGGINLEDIAAPKCVEIERRLIESLDIPVFHDDQHGTAIVVLAGLINALKLVKKSAADIKITIAGVGAAGTAIARLLDTYGVGEIVMVDSKGIVGNCRIDLSPLKEEIASFTNPAGECCSLEKALTNADVFIGVSAPGLLTAERIKLMKEGPIIMAMANPVPEIMPEEAYAAGAAVVATGRSDMPNQLNNVLAFPGVFRGALDGGIREITTEMKLAAAQGLAELVAKPTVERIIPSPFDEGVAEAVAMAVQQKMA